MLGFSDIRNYGGVVYGIWHFELRGKMVLFGECGIHGGFRALGVSCCGHQKLPLALARYSPVLDEIAVKVAIG